MFTDAERETLDRALWGVDRWTDYVEAGPTRDARVQRLDEVPDWCRVVVTAWATRRAARAARPATELS